MTKADCVVGFDALPEQLVNRAVQSGFSFNVLCVGEPGVGKTTLLESLFAIKLDDGDTKPLSPQPSLLRNTYLLTEGNVRLKVTFVETVDYGNQIDKRNCHLPITEYIDAQFLQTLNNELRVVRHEKPFGGPPCSNDDTCVHVCLYLIEPTGHSLKALDLVTLRHLDSKVNIVPVIAKADTLSKSELLHMRKMVREELKDVRLYRWPTDDENVAPLNSQMNDIMPFAVVGSSEFVKAGNKSVRGRQYPWGVVQVENEHHCDFVRLREMLLRTNMLDLIETTHSAHYELYRRNTLSKLGIGQPECDDAHPEKSLSPIELFEARRLALRNEWEQKESRLKETFIEKVKEKESELKKIELDIQAEMASYKQWYRERRESLEAKLDALNSEISSFENGRKSGQRFTAIGRKIKR